MDINRDEIILVKPMKYLAKINIVLLTSCSSLIALAQVKNEVKSNSTLACMQGVWQPTNSRNEGLVEYVVYDSFNSISVSYTTQGKLERVLFTINGFYSFDNGYSLSDSLIVSELSSSGTHYVWFFAEDVRQSGWAQIAGVQSSLLCDDDVIEMSDNAMTILEKRSYLPYTAYHHLKEQGRRDNQDYIGTFNILDKIKRAKVIKDRTYFHNDPSQTTRRKAFVVKADVVIVDQIEEDWIKVAYEGEKITTEGWLQMTDVEIMN